MKFIVCDDYNEMSKEAAAIAAAQIKEKSNTVLGLATGSTPVGMYKELIEMNKKGEISFKDVVTYNLDEYYPISPENNQSYRYFMDTNLFSKINIDRANTYVPGGCSDDMEAEGKAYDELIESLGGIDLQLLGIGLDGHIGFNEPDDVFTAGTHVVELDESTIEANARFFASIDDVPRSAITMGMGAIMQAKKVLLIANGKNKEDILNKAFFGPITPRVPASILQLHPDVTVIYSEN